MLPYFSVITKDCRKHVKIGNKVTKHYLIITHAFPPKGGGGVQRIVKFAKYIQTYGWKATVVCPTSNNYTWIDPARLEEVENINVIRIPMDEMKKGIWNKIKRKLQPIDPFLAWSKDVVRELLSTDLSTFELVFTSGPPHSVHHVGRKISSAKNLAWVADFRDHFTLGPEYKPATIFHKWYNHAFEGSIYEEANAIITNTELNKVDILNTFQVKGLKDKVHTIYNGYDEDDLRNHPITISWNKDKMHLLYLGGLRGDHIDGVFYTTIAHALSKVPWLKDKIRIHIIGDISRKGNLIETLGLTEVFVFESSVPYNQVGAYLEKADAGITWQRDRKAYRGTIAGKFFDYIGKELPIFSLGQEDGEIATILRTHKIGRSASPSNLDIASDTFIEFCEGLSNKKYHYTTVTIKTLELKFSRKNQAAELNRIFNQIIQD